MSAFEKVSVVAIPRNDEIRYVKTVETSHINTMSYKATKYTHIPAHVMSTVIRIYSNYSSMPNQRTS